MLDDIQQTLFDRALVFRKENTVTIDDHNDFYDYFTPKDPDNTEIHGGFAMSHWCGSEACESTIKDDLSVTIRCIPLDNPQEQGSCICCGKPSKERVVYAKAY